MMIDELSRSWGNAYSTFGIEGATKVTSCRRKSSEAGTNGVAANRNTDLSKTMWRDIITHRVEMSRQ
jgi:hypothetical protein